MRATLIPSCCALLLTVAGAQPAATAESHSEPQRPRSASSSGSPARSGSEDVYWSHRIWPRENPGAKPARQQVMPAARWPPRSSAPCCTRPRSRRCGASPSRRAGSRPSSDRIGARTRDPELLREIVAPSVPIRSWWPSASSVLGSPSGWFGTATPGIGRSTASCASAPRRSSWGRVTWESRRSPAPSWSRRNGCAGRRRLPGARRRRAGADFAEWDERIGRLASSSSATGSSPLRRAGFEPGAARDATELARFSPLFEEADHFGAVAVLSPTSTASAWRPRPGPSRPSNKWLASHRHELRLAAPVPASYILPAITAANLCLDDTWQATAGGVPSPGATTAACGREPSSSSGAAPTTTRAWAPAAATIRRPTAGRRPRPPVRPPCGTTTPRSGRARRWSSGWVCRHRALPRHRRPLRSGDRQLDADLHQQRTSRPRAPQRRVDRHRDDRLGRHRRLLSTQLRRALRPAANTWWRPRRSARRWARSSSPRCGPAPR